MGDADFNFVRIDLPIVPDTNLSEKYLELYVRETSDACTGVNTGGYPAGSFETENVMINGKNFIKQSGSDAGVGNYWHWIAYTTGRTGLCVSFEFILHYTNRYNYPTPPPEFDFDLETAVFEQIVETFDWYLP